MKKMKKEMKVKKGNLKKLESVVYAGSIRAMLIVAVMFFFNFSALLQPHSSWHIIFLFVFFANLMYMCSRVAFLKQDAVLEWVNDMVDIDKAARKTNSTPVAPVTSELPEIDPIPQVITK